MRRIRGKYGQLLILLLTVMLSALLVMPVLAGDGDGSGGGQNVPLQLASSTPSNGQADVSPTAEIQLTFNKNVINMTVIDNNKKCFSLAAADGKQIPIEVIMADDQINPELKREVGIKPLQALEPGTVYTLEISAQMQAKSGSVMDNDVKITFTTSGIKKTDEGSIDSSSHTEKTVPETEKDVSKTPDSTVTSDSTKQADSTVKNEEPQTDKQEDVATTNDKDTKTENKAVAEKKTAEGGGAQWLIVVLVIAVAACAGCVYYLKRK